MPPDLMGSPSLSWALTHVRRYGDTDIFPTPFEYEAIAHDWNLLSVNLAARDFADYRIGADRRVMMLKPGGGFRAATQLDPLDHLIYTAAVYEAAPLIERTRIPADQNVACSYRIALTPEGAFFAPASGWNAFHDRSRELATQEFTHVFVADIADFYNQIGQHRVQNALESAGVTNERSRNLERFLNHVTAKQSRGLPVGPYASILLSEACLIDVDNLLLRIGCEYVRFVDDFRIFTRSRKHAVEIRHRFAKYLFEVHRLSLEGGKTYVHPIERFVTDELTDPEEQERNATAARLSEIFDEIAEERGPYWEGELDAEEDQRVLTQAQRESFTNLFRECVQQRPLHLGLARYLLRKAIRLRTVLLLEIVMENLESLAPVMREVARYLTIVIPENSAQNYGERLIEFCRTSDVGSLPFVRMWALDLLLQRLSLSPAAEALQFAAESIADLGDRPVALIAGAHRQVDWVRDRKETWRNYSPWDRRALLWSTQALPRGERHPFLSLVIEQGDPLDAAIAKYLRSLPN
jgi:hypothetical protein